MAVQKRIDIFLNGKQAGQTIGELYKSSRKLKNEINKLTPGTEAYKKKLEELRGTNAQLEEHRKKIKGIGGAFGSIKKGVGQLKSLFLGPLGVVGLVMGVVGAFKNWINTNKQLEKALSSLRSLTNASKEDLKVYKQEAIEIGRTTTLSAIQAVDGFKLIGSARPELLKNRDALIDVTKEAVTLAEASGDQLGPSAQALVGIMNQYGLANEYAADTSNTLAAGSLNGAANIQNISDTIDKAGTVAAGYNVSLEETVGLTETLAEKNIKGAEAGTKLRNFMLKMQTVEALPPMALEQLEKYGVDIELVADKTVPFQDRLTEMSKIAGDATALTKVFGIENQVVGSILLNNVDTVNDYTKAVTGTNTAYEQAAINTDNYDGDLKSLASAWEGLNLSIAGSTAILRPFVQALTSVVNWFSDLISAYKETDKLKIENVWLRWGIAINGANSALGKLYRLKLRLNELNSKIIDDIKTEAREVDIFTTAIAQNNLLLNNANLTEEEAIKLHEQNHQMVEKLKEEYPELTNEIDFQTASYEELSVLQKTITENLVSQAIETAKVAEQERILNAIVEKNMELSKLKIKLQTEGELSFGEALRVNELGAELEQEQFYLETFTETFKNVEETVNGLDLNYGVDFDTNTQMIIDAQNQLAIFNKQLENASSENEKLVIQAQIDAGKKLLEKSGQVRMDQIDALLEDQLDAVTETEEEITGLTAEELAEQERLRKAAAKKAAAARQKNLDDLQKELQKVIEATANFEKEAANKAKVDAENTEQGKELAQLEIDLEKKYGKQIAAAEKLAAGEGAVAQKAQEQLKALRLLKTTETEQAKKAIQDKYNKIEIDQETEKQDNIVAMHISAQRAYYDLKVQLAANATRNIDEFDLEAQNAANAAYNAALIEQLEFEKAQKVEALLEQFVNEEINQEELNTRKEELELEHQQKITDINKEAAQERADAINQQISDIGNAVKKGIEVIGKFRQIALNKDLQEIDAKQKKAIDALNEEKAAGLITEKQYNAEKSKIEKKYDDDRRSKQEQEFKKQQNAAVIQATIDGIMAASKAFAMYGPPPSPVGIAAAAFAAINAGANIALIKSKPVPQFFEGGLHQVTGAKDGRQYNARYLGNHAGGMLPSNPSLVLASERGPEYYVPNHLLSNPSVANYVGLIEAIRTNQMAEGGFSGGSAAVANATVTDDQTMMAMIKTFNQISITLSGMNSKLSNLTATIERTEVDEITTVQQELADIRS